MNLWVAVDSTAVETIRRQAQESADGRETGGLLLGFGPADDGGVRVIGAGGPGPTADRRPDFFLRDLEYARGLARDAWVEGGAEWVGEWHTHPTGGCRPSKTDLATYIRLLRNPRLRFDLFVSIVVTPHPAQTWEDPLLALWLIKLADDCAVVERQALRDP